MGSARRTILFGLLLGCPLPLLWASSAVARIKPPQFEELVDSADLIVIGRVKSVKATSPAMLRQVARIAVTCGVASVAVFLVRRKRWSDAVVLVAIGLIGVALIDVPFGTHRRVARVEVTSSIAGATPAHEIVVYYDDGFVCDVTHFVAGRTNLLFLKEITSGYARSWYDYGQWTVEDGLAQTERRTWTGAAAIPLADLVARINACYDKHRERSEPHDSNEEPAKASRGDRLGHRRSRSAAQGRGPWSHVKPTGKSPFFLAGRDSRDQR